MNTWINSCIISNRVSDLYSEHSDVGSISRTRTHATDKIEGWLGGERHSQRAGEALQDVQRGQEEKREGGVENQNTHNTQISLNKQKLG